MTHCVMPAFCRTYSGPPFAHTGMPQTTSAARLFFAGLAGL